MSAGVTPRVAGRWSCAVRECRAQQPGRGRAAEYGGGGDGERTQPGDLRVVGVDKDGGCGRRDSVCSVRHGEQVVRVGIEPVGDDEFAQVGQVRVDGRAVHVCSLV